MVGSEQVRKDWFFWGFHVILYETHYQKSGMFGWIFDSISRSLDFYVGRKIYVIRRKTY